MTIGDLLFGLLGIAVGYVWGTLATMRVRREEPREVVVLHLYGERAIKVRQELVRHALRSLEN